ncbi:MAG TPA: hypothetical protein PKA96_00295, partial [Candidatus Paceibacterota bacterium]|nr:hypothetical protein [Candidatus Paceibacterota bacterium]
TGTFTQSGGTFNGGSGTVTITGAFNLSGTGIFNASTGTTQFNGNFINTTGGTFNHSGGTVIFGGSFTTIDVNSNLEFNNVSINKNATNNYLTIATDDTLIVNGNLNIINAVPNSGTINLKGNITYTISIASNTNYIFSGSNVQNLNHANSTALTTGTVTISNTNEEGLKLNSNAVINNIIITSGSTFNLNGYNLTTNNSFTIQNNATLILTGNETLSHNPTIEFDSTIKYTGNQDVNFNIKSDWTYGNLTIEGNDSNTAFFVAEQTTTINNNLTIKGQENSLLKLRSTVGGTQWNIDPKGNREIQYVDVKDSNNISDIAVNASNSTDSTNNTNWTLTSLAPQQILISAHGSQIRNIQLESDVITNQPLGGAFSLLLETATTTLNSISLEYTGSLSKEYISNVLLRHYQMSGSNSCPIEMPTQDIFDFGNSSSFEDNSNIIKITSNPGVEFGSNNRFCLYPFYSINTGDQQSIMFAGQSIKFIINSTSSIEIANNDIEIKFSGSNQNSASIFGSTIIGQSGVSTLTLKKDDIQTIFYVKNGVLYKKIGSDQEVRLTSNTVNVLAVNFKNLTAEGQSGLIQIELVLQYVGPNRDQNGPRQYFKTTVNIRR